MIAASRLGNRIRELRTAAAVARLIRMESRGVKLPTEKVRHLLPTMSQSNIPYVVLKWAMRVCRQRKGADFSLLTAVLVGTTSDKHQLAYAAISHQLDQDLPAITLSDATNITKTDLARLSYLLSLLHYVQKDARNRIIPPLMPSNAFVVLSTHIKRLGLYEIKTPSFFKIVCDLLEATREFSNQTNFIEDLEFWLGSRLCDLGGLSQLLLISQSSMRGRGGAFTAYELVSRAINRAYPSEESFVRYIKAGLSGSDKAFGKRCSVVSRVLLNLGRETDLMAIFSDLEPSLEKAGQRLELAVVLLSTKSRWAIMSAVEILTELKDVVPCSKIFTLKIRAKMARADWHEVERLLDDTQQASTIPLSLEYEARKALGQFDRAAATLGRIYSENLQKISDNPSNSHVKILIYCKSQEAELEFLREITAQLDVGGETARPCGVVVILDRKVWGLEQTPILALAELKRRGYAIVALAPGLLPPPLTGIHAVDDIHAQIGDGFTCTRWQMAADGRPLLLNEWEIDLARKRVFCRGVNFYQGIFEALCCEFRRYTIDFNHELIRKKVSERIAEMDFIIYCIDQLRQISLKYSMPIRILSSVHHSGFGYAARFYSAKVAGDCDLAFIGCQSGYDNYYGNFREEIANTIALQDLTRNAEQSRPAAASAEDFNRWYEEWRSSNLTPAIPRVVFENRVQRRKIDKNAAKLLERIVAHRQSGKSVVAMFGKVLFDHAVPYDGGPAHEGMRDWVSHCYQIAVENPDLILLIKPHPHEIRDEIALFPSEVLRDWLPPELAPNVFFLDHNMFNLHELSGVLDLGVVWNSTVCLELGVLGIPCVVSSWYGALDFPVDHFTPKDRADFEKHVIDAKKLRPSAETARRSAGLIQYLRSEGVSTPYRYTIRTLTNKHLRERGWIAADLQRYRQVGDPYVKLLADRVEQSFIG